MHFTLKSFVYNYSIDKSNFTSGVASRLCDGDLAVWQDPNVENCSTVEITRIKEEVEMLMAIFAANQNVNNSDRTIMVEPEVIQSITGELADATTEKDRSILPNDLRNVIDTTGAIIKYIYN